MQDALATPLWWHREITEGDEGDDVRIVQRKLGVPETGVYDHTTAARVRGYQKQHGLEETGTVTKKTAKKAGDKATKGQTPAWYTRDLDELDTGTDVKALRDALHVPLLPDYYDHDLADAVRRFQSSVGIKPTGKLDRETAVALEARTA